MNSFQERVTGFLTILYMFVILGFVAVLLGIARW